jgi:DNA-binding NarL/FixJ family response regulator
MQINTNKAVMGSERPKIRILIADDHAVFRDCLCQLIAFEEDLEVVGQAADGTQVADALRCHQPDILLLDLNMPGHDGFDTLQAIRSSGITTRVIVLTASEDMADTLRAVKLGCCGVVSKQTATDVLVDSIRRVHAGEMTLDSRAAAAVIGQLSQDAEVSALSLPGSPASQAGFLNLSPRELEIAGLVAQGLKNKAIAEKMMIGEQTVKNHLHAIFDKVGVADRLQLALYVIEQGLAIIRLTASVAAPHLASRR